MKLAVALGHEFQRFLLRRDLDLKNNKALRDFCSPQKKSC